MQIAKGAYVIVRARDDGVTVGTYECHVGNEVHLLRARRIHTWNADGEYHALECIDLSIGVPSCRVSRIAENGHIVVGMCGLTPCAPGIGEQYFALPAAME